jgi:murein DD-endopeptidase MepM/ murein hydrolase activator NlpD
MRRAGTGSQRLSADSAPIHTHPPDPARSHRTVAHVRATSPPPALTVAAAILVAALLALAVPAAAKAERWLRPVPGDLARSFSYARATPFARGAHRGADLAARPGTPVRSACAGTVTHAGPVAGHGGVVSVRCGARRVSYLPLARVTVRAGAAIPAGAPIGTVAGGHGGLHFGVRREADRLGYEDPLSLLAPPARPRAPTPVAVRRGRPRPAPRTVRPVTAPRPAVPRPAPVITGARRPAPRPAPVLTGPSRPAPRSAPSLTGRRRTAPRPAPRLTGRRREAPRSAPPLIGPRLAASPLDVPPDRVAPWPVWAGLGLLLAGAAGSGTVVVRRRRARRATAGAAVTRAAA